MSGLRAMAIHELPEVGEAAVCMGVFDGVHRGHLALVEATVQAARQRGLKAVALVFDPHPDEVVRPGTLVARLAPLHENMRRLTEASIDVAVPLRGGRKTVGVDRGVVLGPLVVAEVGLPRTTSRGRSTPADVAARRRSWCRRRGRA